MIRNGRRNIQHGKRPALHRASKGSKNVRVLRLRKGTIRHFARPFRTDISTPKRCATSRCKCVPHLREALQAAAVVPKTIRMKDVPVSAR